MRVRVEFTTEPFDLDEVPGHAVAAREAVEGARGLESVDVGPFGTTAEGDAETVLAAVDTVLRRSLGAGASRVTLQVNVVDAAEGDAG
ncbi:thiamine-binding protein [Streptomyces sp. CO7]